MALVLLSGCAAVAVLCRRSPGWPPPAGPVRADLAIVLSGDVDYLRLQRAIALYRAGSVAKIVLTGSGYGGDSAQTMAAIAVSRGVPAAAILQEDRSTTTRENLLLAAPLLREQGARRVALVTSTSHMGRALRTAAHALPEVQWVAVAVPDAGPPLRICRTRLLEWWKLAWYAAHGWI